MTKNTKRKFSDEDLITAVSVGLRLRTIAELFKCHPSALTHRLKALGIDHTDSRHAFMEDIFLNLTNQQKNWLAKKVKKIPLKQLIQTLLIKEFENDRQS